MNPPYVTEEMAKAFQDEQQRWGIVEPGLGTQSRFGVIHVEQVNGINEARSVMSFGLQNEAVAYHASISVRSGIAAAIKAAGGWDQARAALSTEPSNLAALQVTTSVEVFGEAARIADNLGSIPYDQCERLGIADPETGVRECSLDVNGHSCLCDHGREMAESIVTAIRKRAEEVAKSGP